MLQTIWKYLQTYKLFTKEHKLLREFNKLRLFFFHGGSNCLFGQVTLVLPIRRNLRETGYYPQNMHELWQPVKLKLEMTRGSFLASAMRYKFIFVLQLRKPEARGVKIWPTVTLAAGCFPWVTSHGNYCVAFRDFCLESFLFNLPSSAY